MLTVRLAAALFGSALINLNLTTCRSPGESERSAPESEENTPNQVKLEGVDTSELSPREQARWSTHVNELLAPCADTPVSLAKCVEEKRSCAACQPAAEYLVTQVREGKTQGQVEASYKERFAAESVLELDLSGSPSKGSPDAPITIVEFADFECGMCRMASGPLNDFVKANSDVRLVFKNFPLSGHEHAEEAARAAMAADMQGKFWEMHQAIFAAPALTDTAFLQMAGDLKLDVEKFKKDLSSEAIADAVSRDRKLGEQVKLTGTPTIFINGRRFAASADLKTGLEEWVSLERKLLGAPSPQKSAPAAPVVAPVEPSK